MADYIYIANKMAKDFIRSGNKKYALNKIIHDINLLVYSDTKELLSYKAKTAIIKHIIDLLACREMFLRNEVGQAPYNLTDIIIFFERESFIRNQLRTCLKQRTRMN
jgi:hypothetical protein